jgi:dTDP-4-dehydrorhamnose reductase
MKFAIIGSKGMLGSEFVSYCKEKNINFSSFDLDDMDITKKETLYLLKDLCPDVIINCSAYTAVDKAEEEKDIAFLVNAKGAQNLAEIASQINAKLVHFSTDYVFDGKKNKIFIEKDEVSPINVYGESKLKGEKLIKSVLPIENYLILRTAWLYGKGGRSFVSIMLELANQGKDIKVINDQVGSPTYTKDLVIWTMALINENKSGLYHAVNSGQCSWFEFAKKIFELSNFSPNLEAISEKEYITKAKRPSFSIMDNTKLSKDIKISIRYWQEALSEFILLNKLGKE